SIWYVLNELLQQVILTLVLKYRVPEERSEYLAIPVFKAQFLYHWMSYSKSVTGVLFTGFSATQRYKVYPYAMDTRGVAQLSRLRHFLALLDSTPDSSTTGHPIPILLPEYC